MLVLRLIGTANPHNGLWLTEIGGIMQAVDMKEGSGLTVRFKVSVVADGQRAFFPAEFEASDNPPKDESPPYHRERRSIRFVEPTEVPDGEAE